MSAHFVLINGRRQSLALRPTALSGGEGRIWKAPDLRGCVAKIHHLHNGRTRTDRAKLMAMIARPPDVARRAPSGRLSRTAVDLPMLTWPTHLVEDTHGECIGFLMPEIPLDQTVPLTRYMSRATMRPLAPRERGLAHRLSLCRSFAATVAGLHRQGHYLVDIKPQNILVQRATGGACVVDTDGFSIAPADGSHRRFPASALTPEYAAPELLRNALPPSAVVNDMQDRFALAVLIHQVLNYGFHPFQGVPTRDVDEWNVELAIRQGCYANGLTPSDAVSPARGSSHGCWDADTRAMFDLAFTAAPSQRPTAQAWQRHIDELLSEKRRTLVPCRAQPADPSHTCFAGLPCAECRHQGQAAATPVHHVISPAHRPASPPAPAARTRAPVTRQKASTNPFSPAFLTKRSWAGLWTGLITGAGIGLLAFSTLLQASQSHLRHALQPSVPSRVSPRFSAVGTAPPALPLASSSGAWLPPPRERLASVRPRLSPIGQAGKRRVEAACTPRALARSCELSGAVGALSVQ